MYFIGQDAATFKATLMYQPYFLVAAEDQYDREVENFLRRKYETQVVSVAPVEKEDLDLPNHLSGLKRTYLMLKFRHTQDLVAVRNELLAVVKKNQGKQSKTPGQATVTASTDFLDYLVDLREFDVLYHMRVAIDIEVRVAYWYDRQCRGRVCNY